MKAACEAVHNELMQTRVTAVLNGMERDDLKKAVAHRIEVSPTYHLVADAQALQRVEGAHWSEQYVGVPLLSDAAAAGNPREVNDGDIEGYAIVYAAWVSDLGTTRCLRVQGHSMERVLFDGSIVVIDVAQYDAAELDGAMVAARSDGGVTIKWLELADDSLILRPENPAHRQIVVPYRVGEANPIIGRVTNWWSHAPRGEKSNRNRKGT